MTPRTCARRAAPTRRTTSTCPARDHPLVVRLRQAGAIILAKANCTEYNAAGLIGDPGGEHKPASALPSTLGYQRSTWGGNPSNPYDTARSASLGSSSGSAVSVATKKQTVHTKEAGQGYTYEKITPL